MGRGRLLAKCMFRNMISILRFPGIFFSMKVIRYREIQGRKAKTTKYIHYQSKYYLSISYPPKKKESECEYSSGDKEWKDSVGKQV